MKRARGILLCSALGLFLSAVGLDAATYLPLSDQDLARRSPVIARAMVQGSAVRVESVDGKDLPFTITTLQPIEGLKGTIGAGPIKVRLAGGRVGDQAWWIPGTPVFQKGQEVLVFLEPRAGYPGEYHLSEFGLGHFDILTDREGRRFAVRPAFEPVEDLYLGTLGPEPGMISPERAVFRRDAESLLAMVRSQTRRGDPEDVVVAAPSGDLPTGPFEVRPEWVNLGGTEPGSCPNPNPPGPDVPCLFKWFWHPPTSPNGVVSSNGTQSNLNDSTDGTADVAAMVAQWAGVPASDVRYSSGSGGNVVVNLDVANQGTAWTTPLPCNGTGVVGLGSPGPSLSAGRFKGDSPYYAIPSGNVWVRQMTGTPGCYNATTFKNVVLHEMGHTLGLGHPDQAASVHSSICSCGAVMNSSVTGVTTPRADDIAGIQWYYGTAGPVPTTSFTFSPPSPTVNQTVTFTDASTGAPTSWAWNFGDPASGGANSSSQTSPTHAFASAGTYTVRLTASNLAGSSQASESVSVRVLTPCSADPGTLPANAGHNFCITLSARDQRTGHVGPGLAIPRNNLFGYFSIPALTSNPDNPEVFVKVLDGRVVNGFFWVFYGGLTDLEYTVTVRDFQTGVTRQYLKSAGSADGGFDTLAFSGGSSTVDPPPGAATTGSAAAPVSPGCTGDAGTLCLNASHSFFVSLSARDQRTGHTGVGQAISQNDIFGYFSIPALTSNSDNPEVFVKVLDGAPVNGHFWVFFGGLTDLEYTITVREVSTGRVRTYFEPAGSAAGGFDTLAF